MFIALHPSAGTSLYGASRWIDLGPVTLQPSEFVKLGIVAFSATVLTRKWKRLDDPGHLLVPLAPVVVGVALIVILQRDLGTTVIIVRLGVRPAVRRRGAAAVPGGRPARSALAATAFLIFGEAYRRTRFVDAFLNPWNDPDGAGFQLIQGMIAFGSGGWTGVGLGASRAKWDFLPNAHSDFIFAIIGEELGLLGALFVLAMFALLLFAGIRIAIARARHVRPAHGGRHHGMDRAADHHQPRRGDRSAAHHRRAAAAAVVRGHGPRRHARGHRRAREHRQGQRAGGEQIGRRAGRPTPGSRLDEGDAHPTPAVVASPQEGRRWKGQA